MNSNRFNWDAVAAIIAALIGLLALLVAGYTAYIQHQGVRVEIQGVRAQVWPYITLSESDMLPNGVNNGAGGRLMAVNAGVGPAIIRSVQVLANGKAEPDWNHVAKAVGYHPKKPPTTEFSTLNGTVLSPGKTINFLEIYGRKAWVKFRAKLFSDIVIRACYCSTLGQCWESTLNFHAPVRQAQSVGSCTSPKGSIQFEN